MNAFRHILLSLCFVQIFIFSILGHLSCNITSIKRVPVAIIFKFMILKECPSNDIATYSEVYDVFMFYTKGSVLGIIVTQLTTSVIVHDAIAP